MTRADDPALVRPYPTLAEAARVWARIGLLSFGGPAGQIALMHRILVDENRWLGERRFLHALNYCMVLPGPEAMQLAVYVGWLMHRTLGGIIAGLFFVLPGVVAIMALSWIYALYGALDWVEAVFFGLKAAVLAIVLQALLRMGGKILTHRSLLAIAGLSFLAIFMLGVPFPLIILGAGLTGLLGARLGSGAFRGGGQGVAREADDADTILALYPERQAVARPGYAMRIAALFLALWLIPVAALFMLLGPANVFAQIAGFFSVLAVVTFGGAYAVLAYVAQEAVQNFGWLAAGEMLDGLAMAETTPGPLIMVTQFVGFMGALRDSGALPPLLAATLGGLLTTWVTFTPCFLWIFLGAPYVERLRGNQHLAAALSAITAAVVGVILNLALWFALHVLFAEFRPLRLFGIEGEVPAVASVDWMALALVLLALLLAFGAKVGPVTLLALSAAAGLGVHLLT
ncbi:MAG: chromate efflux transporter [Natronohydrobacter sp.]|nr:chromate efflux transporter [Natronohydrobacter sp.]